MEEKDIMEMNIADTIMEKPIGFSIDGQRFLLYPPTLGKSYLLSRLTKSLNIDMNLLNLNPYLESMRLAHEHKDIVCRILAYHTISEKKFLLDEEYVQSRTEYISSHLNNEEIAQIFVLVMTRDDISSYIKYLGIDKEQAERKRIMQVKKSKGSILFGGKSAYGTLIDWACERYGWTLEYVVWGISYANLNMLMSDAVSSVYLSEQEMKELGVSDDSRVINADDPNNMALIEKILSE